MLNKAIQALELAKNRHELFFALVHRGLAQTCLGNYAAGLSDLNGTLVMARSERDQNAEVMVQLGLAFSQIVAGKDAAGIASAQQALALADHSGDSLFRNPLNSFIAVGTTRLGKARESLDYWAAARESAKALGGHLLLGEWFAALEAESLVEAGEPAAALERAQEALALSLNTDSMIGEALAERAIGRALAAGSDRQQALAHIERSLEICQSIGARFEVVRAMLAQGEALLACKNPTKAATVLTQAQAMAVECELEQEAAVAQHLLERCAAVENCS